MFKIKILFSFALFLALFSSIPEPALSDIKCSEKYMGLVLIPIFHWDKILQQQVNVKNPKHHRICLAKAIKTYVYNAYDRPLKRMKPDEEKWVLSEFANKRIDMNERLVKEYFYFKLMDRIQLKAIEVEHAILSDSTKEQERFKWASLLLTFTDEQGDIHQDWADIIRGRGEEIKEYLGTGLLPSMSNPGLIDALPRSIIGQIFLNDNYFE